MMSDSWVRKSKYSDAWLLDSGCTYHMWPKREWFSTYNPYDKGSVLTGNDAVCKTVGIGNICMRMFDGQVRTLMNVRQVPDLKKNLLSLELWKLVGTSFLVQMEQSQLLESPWRFLKENDSKLVQVDKKHYYRWCFSWNTEGEYYKILAHASWTHERARSSSPIQKECSTRYQILQTWSLLILYFR